MQCGPLLRINSEICSTHPVTFSQGESRSFLHIRFEELVGEVLCKECKHQAGALRVRDKLSPHQELFSQKFDIGQLFFTWGNN